VHDLSCVIHLHSLHSDGTGTVEEIVAAAADVGVDVVVLTDHDVMAAQPGYHGDVLLLVEEEVSPRGSNHYLAFGLDEPIDHAGMDAAGIVRAVRDAGGFGFAAHPFSKGNERFRQGPMAWSDLDCVDGIEVWSFVTDVAERIDSIPEAIRFLLRPERYASGPPDENLREWDRLNLSRRVVGIGGVDAHQIGRRILDRWVIRLMGYRRSFRLLRTHVLLDGPPTGELEHDREQVHAALREGRSYIAVDHLAPPAGFAFWADPDGAHVRLPRPAELRLLRDGEEVARTGGAELDHPVDAPGSYRVEVRLAGRVWILSNPIRAAA
jgi:PHP domain-containing protein